MVHATPARLLLGQRDSTRSDSKTVRGAGRRHRTECARRASDSSGERLAVGSLLLTRDPVRAREATRHPRYALVCIAGAKNADDVPRALRGGRAA